MFSEVVRILNGFKIGLVPQCLVRAILTTWIHYVLGNITLTPHLWTPCLKIKEIASWSFLHVSKRKGPFVFVRLKIRVFQVLITASSFVYRFQPYSDLSIFLLLFNLIKVLHQSISRIFISCYLLKSYKLIWNSNSHILYLLMNQRMACMLSLTLYLFS